MRHDVESATIAELRTMNVSTFYGPTGWANTVARLWLINTKLTALGIAPAWRDIPAFVRSNPPPPTPPGAVRVRPLGDSLRRSLLRRWIDLEWLRALLGPKHVPRFAKWGDAFSADQAKAERTWARINGVSSSGGGKFGAETPYKVVHGLDLAQRDLFGLVGLINRDAGELLKNARKRVERSIRPTMELLMARASRPLSRAEVERRLVGCEALEIAKGRPAEAATVFGWMTGEPITRQSMHAMRDKVAEQCGLRTRAWTGRHADVGR